MIELQFSTFKLLIWNIISNNTVKIIIKYFYMCFNVNQRIKNKWASIKQKKSLNIII